MEKDMRMEIKSVNGILGGLIVIKSVIIDLIRLNQGGENDVNLTAPTICKQSLVKLKDLIERWDNVSDYFIMNPCHKEKLKITLGIDEYDSSWNTSDYIWRNCVLYLDDCPKDKIIAYAVENNTDNLSRNVAVLTLI